MGIISKDNSECIEDCKGVRVDAGRPIRSLGRWEGLSPDERLDVTVRRWGQLDRVGTYRVDRLEVGGKNEEGDKEDISQKEREHDRIIVLWGKISSCLKI